jgi:hypothetical protein
MVGEKAEKQCLGNRCRTGGTHPSVVVGFVIFKQVIA